jgi:RNA:NAD 2'-phosphotransferase (TPT1/KptA family)
MQSKTDQTYMLPLRDWVAICRRDTMDLADKKFIPQGPLYFGSSKHPAKNRMRWGIEPKKNKILCACTDYTTALQFSNRFGPHGKVIEIDAVRLAQKGYVFERYDDNLVVLSEKITPKFLSYVQADHDFVAATA